MFMKELSIGMDETVKDLLTAHDAMKRFYKLSQKNKKCTFWICMFILAYCLFHIIILVLLDDYKDSNFDSNYVLTNIEMVLMGSM